MKDRAKDKTAEERYSEAFKIQVQAPKVRPATAQGDALCGYAAKR